MLVERRAARQAIDAIDVQARAGDHAAHRLEVRRRQRRAEHRDDVAALALRQHPVAVFLARHRGEADLHAEPVRFEQQVGEQRRRLHLVGQLDQHAERQRVVNQRLADVENAHLAAGQNRGQRVRDARMIVAGDVDAEDTCLGWNGHVNH